MFNQGQACLVRGSVKGRNSLGLHHCDGVFTEEEMVLHVYKKGGGEGKHPPQLALKCALGFANPVREKRA